MCKTVSEKAGFTLTPGSLWKKIVARSLHATRMGALHFIPTETEYISQCGIEFLVRIAPSLTSKDDAKNALEKQNAATKKPFNPFLPYEDNLFVSDISDTHLCILNKFNVLKHHILIITRAFEHQQTLLTLQDFEALWSCMAEFKGLAFYNAGPLAGASQPHKHLQMVPLPLTPREPQIPIQPLLNIIQFHDQVGIIPSLCIKHAITRVEQPLLASPFKIAKASLASYHAMLRAVDLWTDISFNRPDEKTPPYNLLVTREWMLLIPRVTEFYESISVNALGFAGALLVRNEREMKILKSRGPVAILKHVASVSPEPHSSPSY